MDQSKKTMRHFYCRDVLWETFEQMASDFDCSIDYLINEAMRHYARSKNYQAAPGQHPSIPPGGAGAYPPNPATPAMSAGAPGAPRKPAPPPPPAATPTRRPPPPTMPRPRPTGAHGTPGAQPYPQHPPAPQPPAGAAIAQPAGEHGPTLYLIYNNQRYPISNDQFIIGRGSKTADLPIKDGNISRKHAAVIRRNGTYYIKDLGSTNGIDYRGMRIDNKRIDEGDIFHLCDYELRFTYRPG
jgi:hypothetical protein